MGSPRTDFDLLLEAPDPVEASMARELLASAGIPCLEHGQDRDLAELGSAGHRSIARPDLYVPKGQGARARALLEEAWDETSLSDELALSTPKEAEPVARANSPALRWVVFGVLVGVALAVGYARYFASDR